MTAEPLPLMRNVSRIVHPQPSDGYPSGPGSALVDEIHARGHCLNATRVPLRHPDLPTMRKTRVKHDRFGRCRKTGGAPRGAVLCTCQRDLVRLGKRRRNRIPVRQAYFAFPFISAYAASRASRASDWRYCLASLKVRKLLPSVMMGTERPLKIRRSERLCALLNKWSSSSSITAISHPKRRNYRDCGDTLPKPQNTAP